MMYSRTFTRPITVLGLIVVLLLSGGLVDQAAAGEAVLYLAVESYTWKEFKDNGSLLLKESGPLAGVGFTYHHEFPDHLTLRPTAEIFGGTVDYDGQTQTGIAAKTDVDYFGLKLDGDIGRKFIISKQWFVEPFGGLGLRLWIRDINDGVAANGTATYGYDEVWLTWNARLGLRGGVDISQGSRLFAEVGVKLPLYNENTADLGLDVTMHPGKETSYFAEMGAQLSGFRGILFYEGLRFSKSDEVAIAYGYTVWQPKSEADIYGLKLGVVF
jgi:hypothetical protein